jgi:hypothetical protein
MYFMITTRFSPNKAEEVVRIYTQTKWPKAPEFVKQLFVLSTMAKDIKSYTLFEVKDGKIKEGLGYINEIMSKYFSIEGIKLRIEPLFAPEDALALYGIKTT